MVPTVLAHVLQKPTRLDPHEVGMKTSKISPFNMQRAYFKLMYGHLIFSDLAANNQVMIEKMDG